MSDSPDSSKTHFGYKEVPTEEKESLVAGVFHSVAPKYDVMNDLMSFGLHRIWKFLTTQIGHLKKGEKVLDLAGGTGDLAIAFAKQVGSEGTVLVADINASMLLEGRKKCWDKGLLQPLEFVQANAESLPFPSNEFHRVSIGFGLRNVTHKDLALKEMFRVLKPGGQVLILEFSKPVFPGLKPIYDTYSFSLLPKLGEWIAGDKESYQYLAESIRMHPDQETLCNMMKEAGFEDCTYNNFTGGIVALHRGYKY